MRDARTDWAFERPPFAGGAHGAANAPDPGVEAAPSLLEITLAATGLAAWIWCGFEVLKALIR